MKFLLFILFGLSSIVGNICFWFKYTTFTSSIIDCIFQRWPWPYLPSPSRGGVHFSPSPLNMHGLCDCFNQSKTAEVMTDLALTGWQHLFLPLLVLNTQEAGYSIGERGHMREKGHLRHELKMPSCTPSSIKPSEDSSPSSYLNAATSESMENHPDGLTQPTDSWEVMINSCVKLLSFGLFKP